MALVNPTLTHITESGEALERLANILSTASASFVPAEAKPLEVVLSHVDHQGMLSESLRLFPLMPVSNDGKVLDPFTAGGPLNIIAILNQPVGVQRESVLVYLSAQVARRVEIARLAGKPEEAQRIDQLMSQSDSATMNDVVDRLRHGWQEAAESIALQAASVGLQLRVRYLSTALPGREEVAQRMPTLRRAYNELAVFRGAVDRFVSYIASRGQIVGSSETPEALRVQLQQDIDLPSLRRSTAELIRDSLVVGNGYMAFGSSAVPGVYNLNPDTAIDPGDGQSVSPREGENPVAATHMRGLQQPQSLYGLGLAEVAVQCLQQQDIFAEIDHKMRDYEPNPDQIRATTELRDRTLANADARLRTVFSHMLGLPEPVASLYFDGRERL